MNYEAIIDVWHRCPFCEVTVRFPDTRVLIWDNQKVCVVIIESKDASVLDMCEEGFNILYPYLTVIRQNGRLEIIMETFYRDPISMIDLIAKSDCWHLQPCIIKGGWERYRVHSWEKENISKLVRTVQNHGGKVRLRSLKPIDIDRMTSDMIVPMETIFSDLTERQTSLVLEAYRRGYYDIPAKSDIDDLAKLAGVSRSTMSEHLLKAEWKIMRNLMPLLSMMQKGVDHGTED